jgi:single-stranded-DNA-specific exonuclease
MERSDNLKYKIQGRNNINDIVNCVFENRGISDIQTYRRLTDDILISYEKLDNINKAVLLLDKHICQKNNITIIVDCDVDGQCSAAMMYMYIKNHLNSDIKVTYLLHSGKSHGLSDDIIIPSNTQLLIIPDAGTNDVEQCKKLSQQNVDIIILDHHEVEQKNPYAIVVNNQISKDYENKNLCGAGIVYKFLQALDDFYWYSYADDYLDLVALANISDIMDIRSFETKRLIDKGLAMITNKCFDEFISSQTYLMHGKVNPHTVAFYITPLINAMCRVGNTEEKDLLFRAFIESDEEFNYKKRNQAELIIETVYQRAVRLCKNAKERQDRQCNKIVPLLERRCINDKNAITFVKDENIPNVFSGLVAMKLADKLKKPCLILHAVELDNKQKIYRGSARNFDNSYIPLLKDCLVNTNCFNWCRGHQGAFGFEISADNINKAIISVNNHCNNRIITTIVDFEVEYENFHNSIISDVVSLENYYGTGIKEPLFAIRNIVLERNQGVILGKERTTWKFITDDNIAIIKFKNSEDDPVLNFINELNEEITINALCKVGMSEYKGIITPQIVIQEYEVVK